MASLNSSIYLMGTVTAAGASASATAPLSRTLTRRKAWTGPPGMYGMYTYTDDLTTLPGNGVQFLPLPHERYRRVIILATTPKGYSAILVATTSKVDVA